MYINLIKWLNKLLIHLTSFMDTLPHRAGCLMVVRFHYDTIYYTFDSLGDFKVLIAAMTDLQNIVHYGKWRVRSPQVVSKTL